MDRAGWMPIESAPKDGTRFDVWMCNPDYPDGYRLPSCSWSAKRSEIIDANRVPINALWRDGQWQIRGTHWRYLPEPPTP